jgi:CRISPR type III-associated protein (TIGR04423 family)
VKEEDFNNPNVEVKEFLPNRMDKVEKLRFLEYWKPQEDKKDKEDSLCENMKVLQPAELVFIGFKNKEE